MDVLRLPLVLRLRIFGRHADGDGAERLDVVRQAERRGDGGDPLFGRVAGRPDGAQSEGVGGEVSRFDILSSPTGQLRNLIRYKRCLFWDGVIGVSLAVAGIAGALLLEAWASLTGLTLVLLTALIAVFCAWFNWQKHKGMIREVEQSLGELKEFEAA